MSSTGPQDVKSLLNFLPLFSSVNLDKLWSLVSEESRLAAAKDTTVAPVIDVTKRGFFKVNLQKIYSSYRRIG